MRVAPIDSSFFSVEREADLQVIGTAAPRLDARDPVTGRTQYFEDISYPGLTHLKMHRSARHHALLKRVHTAPALAVPVHDAGACGAGAVCESPS